MTNTMNTGSHGVATLDGRVRRGVANPAMFFRRWLANPRDSFVVCSVPTDRKAYKASGGRGGIGIGGGYRRGLTGTPGRRRATGAPDRRGDRPRNGRPPARRVTWRGSARGRREGPA